MSKDLHHLLKSAIAAAAAAAIAITLGHTIIQAAGQPIGFVAAAK